jgi:mono/diheme cytochrome c family protein
MNKGLASVATIGLLAVFVAAFGQPGMMGPGMMGHGNMMGMSVARRHLVMMNGLDPKYITKANPLTGNEQTLKNGRKLFEQHCARCHGINGLGDGPDGTNLYPPPANVAAASKMPMASDSYLFWTISEGGAPVRSAMPPFKQTLKEDDIWQIITYLRVL